MIAHYVAVTVWVEGTRRLPAIDARQRLSYYFGFANTCLVISAVMTGAGWMLSAVVPLVPRRSAALSDALVLSPSL